MSVRLIKGAAPDTFSPYIFSPTDASAHFTASGATAAFAGQVLQLPVTPPPARPLTDKSPSTLAPSRAGAEGSHHDADPGSENTHAEAQRLIAEAQASASRIEDEARERGLAEARDLVAEEAARMVEPLREKLAQSITEIADLHASIAARTERDVVRLAIEIAKKIVHREVTIDREIALTLARVALARLHDRALATVHLHPDDYGYVSSHTEMLRAGGPVEIVEDRSIGRGGCLIRSEIGDIDARIEQQFTEIERGFLS